MPVLNRIKYLKLLFTLLLIGVNASSAFSQEEISLEYQIKAAFLYNFTQFVEWPEDCFNSDKAPLVIAVYGKNPFKNFLEEVIAGEYVKGHPLQLVYYNSIDDIQPAHILFVYSTRRDELNKIMAITDHKTTLTVGSEKEFIEAGGMVRFITKDNKIKFEINTDKTKAARFQISSKVLRLAEVAQTKQEE